jgi:hypothetical protein
MPTIKCEVCKRIHVVQRYDKDYICNNSVSQKKIMNNVENEDMMTRNNWNLNEWDTKKDAYRDVYLDKLDKMTSDKNKYAGGTESHNY